MTSTATPPTGQGIDFRVDTKGLDEAFRRGPSTVYYWLRGYLGGAFIAHRTYWLRAKSTKFGRGGANSRATKVFRLNEATGTPRPNHVVYSVTPTAKRERDPARAAAALQQLQGAAFAGSIVLEVHQQGRDITSPKWMAIALRTRPKTPAAWRAKNPAKRLITIRDAKNPNRLYLAERQRKLAPRPAGAKATGSKRRRVKRDVLIRRFLLLRRVDMRPTLNFYESWASLAGDRAREFSNISNRILQDLANGKLT